MVDVSCRSLKPANEPVLAPAEAQSPPVEGIALASGLTQLRRETVDAPDQLVKRALPIAETSSVIVERASPAPKRASPVPKRASPAPKRASPALKRASPAPKRASPAPKRALPVPKPTPPLPNGAAEVPDAGPLATNGASGAPKTAAALLAYLFTTYIAAECPLSVACSALIALVVCAHKSRT